MFNVGSVQGYLRLDTSGWTRAISTSEMSLRSLSATFVKTSALVLGSVAIVEREFGKFDKAIRHATSVTLDLTNAQFAEMSEMALDASVKWNKVATDTAQAFYFLGSAGLTATEQMQTFNDTIMLSRAMGSDLATTVEGMVDIIRAFGLEFADSTAIGDQLTKTVVTSNQMFQDLDKALSYASSTARLANNTLAETAAMLGIMANAGIKGSMAGTVLRRAITNLMSPTAEMRSLMYALGLNIYDTTGVMKPFIDIIGEISDQLVGSSNAYKNMVYEVLFGRRAIAGQITLFNYGSKALRKYASEIQNSSGTMKQVADNQMKAFTEQLGQLWREVQRVGIDLGSLLAPAIARVGQSIRLNLAGYREYIEANSKAVEHTLKLTAAISALVVIGGPLIMITTGITRQMIALAGVIATPFTVLLLALYTLRATLDTDFWKGAWNNGIKPFLSDMSSGFAQTLTQIMWQFSLIPDIVIKTFSKQMMLNTVLYFAKALQQVGLGARMAAAALHADFKEVARLGSEFKTVNDEMRGLLGGTDPNQNAFTDVVFDSAEERDASFNAYKANIISLATDLGSTIKDAAAGLVTNVVDKAQEDFEALTTLFTTTSGDPDGILGSLLNSIQEYANGVRDIFKVFTAEPMDLSGELDKVSVLLDKVNAKMRELSEKTVPQAQERVSIMAAEWTVAIQEFFKVNDADVETWSDSFQSTLGDIRTAWANTINDFISKGGNLKDFMEDMFLGILNALNRTVAQIATNDLLFSVFGGKEKFPGGPSFIHGPASILGGAGSTPGAGSYSPGLDSSYSNYGRKAVATEINITNNGNPVDLRVTGRKFDGQKWVINAVMDELKTNKAFAKAVARG